MWSWKVRSKTILSIRPIRGRTPLYAHYTYSRRHAISMRARKNGEGPMSFLKLITAAVAIAVVICASNSTPAQSLTIKSDGVSINGGDADFGAGGHNFGGAGNATITWKLSTVNSALTLTAQVRGTVYLDSTNSGCAAVRISFVTESSQPAPGNSGRMTTVCG